MYLVLRSKLFLLNSFFVAYFISTRKLIYFSTQTDEVTSLTRGIKNDSDVGQKPGCIGLVTAGRP